MDEFLIVFHQEFYKIHNGFDSVIVITDFEYYRLENAYNKVYLSDFFVYNKGRITNNFYISKYWSGYKISDYGKKKGSKRYNIMKKWKNSCGDNVTIISKIYNNSTSFDISRIIFNHDDDVRFFENESIKG